jgi:anti-sigma B factor antagonist
MSYTVQQDSGYDIVCLTGDIDLSCSPQARRTILACLSRGHHTLVDLSGVSYIDSSGVASLVEGFQAARKHALRFGLLGVSDAAMSVLALARLDTVFPIHADLAARLTADG